MKKIFLILFIISFGRSGFMYAQSDSTAKQKTIFRPGVFYVSHLNYYGRTDSLKSSAVFPLLEVAFPHGIYINSAPVFIHNSSSSGLSYAGTVATAGYKFSRSKNSGHIYFVKPFYKSSSGLVQSALKAQFSMLFSHKFGFINTSAGGDLKFSDNIDAGLSAALDHIFRINAGNGFLLVMNPTATLNAGTQRFTNTYYKRNNFLFFPGAEQTVTENVNAFNILSYEFSMPVILVKGKWQLIANPAYVIPQNLVTVPGRPDLTERGDKLFYITLGTRFSFQ